VDIKIDHLMWGAPNLDTGIATAQELFGVTAAPGGSHPGLGTRNALLALGKDVYLEIIAPDLGDPAPNSFGERLAALNQCQLITWAVGSDQLETVAAISEDLGLTARGPVETHRSTPEGELLSWELLFLGGHQFGGLMPFFIDWCDTTNPALVNPKAGTFIEISLYSPDAPRLSEVFEKLGLDVTVSLADKPAIEVAIETPDKQVKLQANAETLGLRLF
jgi:hypothetical protein